MILNDESILNNFDEVCSMSTNSCINLSNIDTSREQSNVIKRSRNGSPGANSILADANLNNHTKFQNNEHLDRKISTAASYNDTVMKLKESTQKLLCIIEEIQLKTHAKSDNTNTISGTNLYFSHKPALQSNMLLSAEDATSERKNNLKNLEALTKNLDSISIQDDDDDCSVYKRLTRKCNCLNEHHYNDFIIHFNEDTKHRMSVEGEIIKNIIILKKFLYMNGNYTKNALLFFNEGLADCSHSEKVEIIKGCAHADICNVFDGHSIVTMYILWPCKNEYCGDAVTQSLTASFLHKLAQLEEGRRYLNLSSKITSDLKRVLKKKSPLLEYETVEILKATVDLLSPLLTSKLNYITSYCKPIAEGIGKKTVNSLIDHREYMTLDEVFAHLELLHNLSNRDNGKIELNSYLIPLLVLFKRLLVEYDNSQINILVTNILNNVIRKNVVKKEQLDIPNTFTIADMPIQMKNEMNQSPPKKLNTRKVNRSQMGLGVSRNKFCSSLKNKDLRDPVIVVPVDKRNDQI